MFLKSHPDPGSVHVTRPLTNFSHMYIQSAEGFVADSFAINLPVQKKTDEFFKYPKGFRFRDAMKRRAPNSESAGIGYDVTTDTYRCDVWALHMDIPDQVRANEDSPLNSDRTAAETLAQLAMIKREKLFASTFMATSVWSTDVTGVSGAPAAGQVRQWNDSASTPIKDVRAYKTAVLKATGMLPNILVVGQEVHDALESHPEILDRIKYGQTPGQPAQVTNQALAALFGVAEYRVGSAIEDTSVEKVTETNTMGFIIGKKALLGYKAPSAQIMRPTAAMTFSWTGLTGTRNAGERVKKYRMEQNGADRIEIEMAFGHKVIGQDLAVLFSSLVA